MYFNRNFQSRSLAKEIVERLLAERDDISKVPIPLAAKAYARRHGLRSMERQPKDFRRVNAMLTNPGKPDKFVNSDASEKSMGEAKAEISTAGDDNDPSKPLERGHVETPNYNGKWPNGIAGKGKISGKFRFPRGFKVGNAMKY